MLLFRSVYTRGALWWLLASPSSSLHISLVSMLVCRDQLLNAYDCVGPHLDSGCATDVLYFDNSKALDVINPAVLLSTE